MIYTTQTRQEQLARLARFEHVAGSLWIAAGVLSLLSVPLYLVLGFFTAGLAIGLALLAVFGGVSDIIYAIWRFGCAKRIAAGDPSVPESYARFQIIDTIFIVVYLLSGNIFSLVMCAYELYIDNQVLKHKEVFGASPEAAPESASVSPRAVPDGASSARERSQIAVPLDAETTAALDVLQKRIAADPLNPDLYMRLADLYRDHGRPREALAQYYRVLELDDQRTAVILRTAEIEKQLGQSDKARKLLERALEISPDDSGVRLSLFHAKCESRLYSDALKLAAGLSPSGAAELPFRLRMYDALSDAGHAEDAVKELRRAGELAPGDSAVWLRLAKLYEQSGAKAEAASAYERVLKADPTQDEALRALGHIRYEERDFRAAAAHLGAAHNASPDDEELSLLLGQAFVELGDTKQAASAIQRVQTAGFHSLGDDARTRLAAIALAIGKELLEDGQPMHAVSWLRTSLSARSDDRTSQMLARALTALANEAKAAGDLKKTSELLSSALEVEPKNADLSAELSSVRDRIRIRQRKQATTVTVVVAGCLLVASAVFAVWHFSTGRLTIAAAVEELKAVSVDGRERTAGQQFRLKRGPHTVAAAAADGFADTSLAVDVPGGGTTTLALRLRPVFGSLSVASVPSGANVYVGNTLLGRTPLAVDSIQAGHRQIALKLAGCLDWDTSLVFLQYGSLDLGEIVLRANQTFPDASRDRAASKGPQELTDRPPQSGNRGNSEAGEQLVVFYNDRTEDGDMPATVSGSFGSYTLNAGESKQLRLAPGEYPVTITWSGGRKSTWNLRVGTRVESKRATDGTVFQCTGFLYF